MMQQKDPLTTASPRPALIPWQAARDQLIAEAQSANSGLKRQTLKLDQALGRVLANSVAAQMSVPPWDNSAMDGYALNFAELQQANFCLPLSGRVAAGEQPGALQPASAVRIFTGAPIPNGADTVVMQEHCRLVENRLQVDNPKLRAGANVRPMGQDIKQGDLVLSEGQLLTPQCLGLLASLGIAEVEVFKPLTIALLSTGEELLEPGEPLSAGGIYNSNRYLLSALLRQFNFTVLDLGIVGDSLEATTSLLQQAAEQADLVLSTGGVSVGEEDYVRRALETIGTLKLYRLAIKPGKPMVYGSIDQTKGNSTFVGLPGNPVSAFVTFALLVLPALLSRQGYAQVLPRQQTVLANFSRTKISDRDDFVRARIQLNAAGEAQAQMHQNQSSGVLSSVCWADGLLCLPAGQTVEPGQPLDFYPMNELLGWQRRSPS